MNRDTGRNTTIYGFVECYSNYDSAARHYEYIVESGEYATALGAGQAEIFAVFGDRAHAVAFLASL